MVSRFKQRTCPTTVIQSSVTWKWRNKYYSSGLRCQRRTLYPVSMGNHAYKRTWFQSQKKFIASRFTQGHIMDLQRCEGKSIHGANSPVHPRAVPPCVSTTGRAALSILCSRDSKISCSPSCKKSMSSLDFAAVALRTICLPSFTASFIAPSRMDNTTGSVLWELVRSHWFEHWAIIAQNAGIWLCKHAHFLSNRNTYRTSFQLHSQSRVELRSAEVPNSEHRWSMQAWESKRVVLIVFCLGEGKSLVIAGHVDGDL